ncbi:SMP-30/gluconolactonase/LRE family protein [Cerasicoccus arenae]|uniref:Gluconolactonase n=1 Tax=Cerasicoccus arenae TaxID=424488 RepID=A0A8J3DBY5_9BACT|nr:SMP-30/gluconolactonase/LRE family protein [Cerasicoccus arenae]MBK1858186.1 SMP-30/gluconolactonase/LRE family protein [Cerasicoccus arenae]GHC00965.1 gluconolactonase [Cerasicoccus arenae]
MPHRLIFTLLTILTSIACAEPQIEQLATGFSFTEGPALSPNGDAVYFSDIPKNRIHRWDATTGEVTVFREDSGGANGLLFRDDNNLIVCAGRHRMLIEESIVKGEATVLAEFYDGKKLNSPNDLWIAPDGGVYFTDPRYGNRDNLEQDGEHVYHLSADRKTLTRVVNDFVRPNGIIGTPDGETLIIADHGAGKTWRYTIREDGTLQDKVLFADQGSDGMSMDTAGNVYLTAAAVDIYSSRGELLDSIELPERPANVSVISEDPIVLFVTAVKSVYRVTLER